MDFVEFQIPQEIMKLSKGIPLLTFGISVIFSQKKSHFKPKMERKKKHFLGSYLTNKKLENIGFIQFCGPTSIIEWYWSS